MKICFITPSLAQGGLENSITVMANEMVKKGNEVSIVCFYNHPIFYKLDISIQVYSPKFKRDGYSALIYYSKTLIFIRSKLRDIMPEVIVSYGDYVNFISIMANIGTKTPLFISDRSSPNKKFPTHVNFFRKKIYPFATGIIAQTERAKQQKMNFLGEKIKKIAVIPNPIRPIINHSKIEKENIILGVARLHPVKRLDILIKAFAELPHANWKLVIAGAYGEHTQELRELIINLNIENKVELLGPIKEIDKVFQRSEIFVLTSESEGFPNALIEAMANGLSCVSYDIVAGPAEIIKNNENGILVPDGNFDLLKSKIQYLMENEEERKRIGQNALNIKKQLSIETIGDLFYNFITSK